PSGITTGPDGALWFVNNNNIGRITTAGVITEFAIPTVNSGPIAIKMGPDGALWFTELQTGKIGRLALTTVNSHDFNADGKSDVAVADGSGNRGVWLMNGAQVTPAGVGAGPAGWFIVGQRDFDGDGRADLLWRDTSGSVGIWFMNGAQATPAGVGAL